MEEQLSPGYQVKTYKGKEVTVQKFLAEGGQGSVYEVDYGGQKKALKWYRKGGCGKNPQAFYNNIRSNVLNGSPSPEFLWPLDITEWKDGTFGYVMDLRPDGYEEVNSFLMCQVRFPSFQIMIDAALHIISAFRILHNRGYSYQDINAGNFFINPQNGNVLICDNDNVAPDGTETGILGTPRYMAPEIVTGKSRPNTLSDRYSMAVLLFMIMCMSHPLEGKRWLKAVGYTAKAQEELYGVHPVFMMDPDNPENAPDKNIHKNVLRVWPCLPGYIQQLFVKAFSERALQNPNARPIELEWIKGLVRFRSEVVRCQCGNEVFTEQGNDCRCDVCRRKVKVPYQLVFQNYSIPGVADTRVYRCQVGTCDAEEALQPMGRVIANEKNPAQLAIRNLSGRSWKAITPSGRENHVRHGELIPLLNDITFLIDTGKDTETIQIKENKR